jgi:(+)-abscisic acid 8'-hydroxylase
MKFIFPFFTSLFSICADRFCVGDFVFSGYLIPKGWKVLPLFRNIHHSPENFKEPEKFDPSRFEVIIVI